MSRFDYLPTLADRPRMAVPKFAGPAPSEKHDAERKADKKALDVWKKAVWKRDKGICRSCGRKVVKVLEAVPERGECHHIAGRADLAVRTDIRNGLLLCLACHEKVERFLIHLVQKASLLFGLKGGPKKYLNGSKAITFIAKAVE